MFYFLTCCRSKYSTPTEGILGSPHKIGLFVRDDDVVVDMMGGDMDVYAESWQVRNTDPQLFSLLREPQFPSKCKYSPVVAPHLRRCFTFEEEAVTRKQAMEVCAKHNSGERHDACVEDVIAGSDLDIADEEMYG